MILICIKVKILELVFRNVGKCQPGPTFADLAPGRVRVDLTSTLELGALIAMNTDNKMRF